MNTANTLTPMQLLGLIWSPDQADGNDQAAWARFADHCKTLTAGQVQQHLAAQGCEVTLDTAADIQREACTFAEHSEIAIIQPHDEHAVAPVDMRNGASGLHGSMVAQGVGMTITPPAPISRAAAEALRSRAIRLIFNAALLDKPSLLTWGQASLNTLNALLDGGDAWARKDASTPGGYDIPASYQTAWAALPVGVERLSLVDVQQHLRAFGIQCPFECITQSQIDAVAQLKDGVFPIAQPHDEHAVAGVDVNDGAGVHGPMVAQRGHASTFAMALLCALCLGALGPALDHSAKLQERIDAQSQSAHVAAQERAKARQQKTAVALCLAERGAGAVATWQTPTTIVCTTRPVRGR